MADELRSASGSIDVPSDTGDGRFDEVSESEPIAWPNEADFRLDRPEAPESPLDRPADAPLLEAGAPLDPSRERVAVAELHAERLMPGTAEEQRRLEAAYRNDSRPESWAPLVNPVDPSLSFEDRRLREENCADCARSFQRGLEGDPVVAARIGQAGLPLADGPRGGGGGEAIVYTEQWAGRRCELVAYGEVHDRLARDGGSAIVMATGAEGGHAFNAYWDEGQGKVRWADAQAGVVADWPPAEYANRFPTCRSIFFDQEVRRDR